MALNSLLYIAAHSAKGYNVPSFIASKSLGVSHSYLEAILSKLLAAGLIRSYRGPGGGYTLAKNPDAISIKDIVNATDVTKPIVDCLGAQLWVKLDIHMQSQMSQIRLSHILASIIIRIDPNLARLQRKSKRAQKSKGLMVPKKSKLNKLDEPLGPNSVFNLGRLQLRN